MKVPAVNLLGGEEGKGFGQLMQQLPQERLSTAILASLQLFGGSGYMKEYPISTVSQGGSP